MFSGDFTLAKDEDFGDYFCDLSEKTNRLVRATVKTYEHTGTYVFLKLFKKKPDAEFALAQKITLTKEEFEILLWKGKSVLQPSNVKKVTKKFKKIKKPSFADSVAEEDDADNVDEENKENIDPRKYGGSNVWTFSRLL